MIKADIGSSPHKFHLRALLLLGAMLFSGCGTEEPVSGPSECRTFDVASHEKAATNGSLESMRQLRDHYIDCNLGRSNAEIVKWGKLAAEHGNTEDKDFFVGISAMFGPKKGGRKEVMAPLAHPARPRAGLSIFELLRSRALFRAAFACRGYPVP